MVNATRRRTLNLNDIIDDETEEFKENVNPIYYNGVRVEWPPERPRIDEFVFTLANGDRIERYHGTDIDDETGEIEDMEIEESIPDPNAMGAGRRRHRRSRKGGRKSRKGRKTRRHRKSRRHRRH